MGSKTWPKYKVTFAYAPELQALYRTYKGIKYAAWYARVKADPERLKAFYDTHKAWAKRTRYASTPHARARNLRCQRRAAHPGDWQTHVYQRSEAWWQQQGWKQLSFEYQGKPEALAWLKDHLDRLDCRSWAKFDGMLYHAMSLDHVLALDEGDDTDGLLYRQPQTAFDLREPGEDSMEPG